MRRWCLPPAAPELTLRLTPRATIQFAGQEKPRIKPASAAKHFPRRHLKMSGSFGYTGSKQKRTNKGVMGIRSRINDRIYDSIQERRLLIPSHRLSHSNEYSGRNRRFSAQKCRFFNKREPYTRVLVTKINAKGIPSVHSERRAPPPNNPARQQADRCSIAMDI